MTQPQFPDRMVARIHPSGAPAGATTPRPEDLVFDPGAPIDMSGVREFKIEINAADGTRLLHLYEEDGRLCAELNQDRADEVVKRFVHAMMMWSGLVGIRWKDEAKRAAEEGGW
jgi:hypothetical protein